MKKVQLLELQKYCGKYKIISNSLSAYKGICGVWVMYDNNNQLIEVAQTSNIFKELDYDLSWLMKDYSNESNVGKKHPPYTARRLFDFNKKFDVLPNDRNRTTAKYRDIAENSEKILVYLIDEERVKSKDKTMRKEIEIAIDNKVLYWNAFGRQRRLAKEYYNMRLAV